MNKVEQVSRRRVRELKYYYVENKIFILIFLGIILTIAGVTIIKKVDFESF